MSPGDKRLGILLLLAKLEVVGIRKVTHSFAAAWHQVPLPTCVVELARIGIDREFLQFCVKRFHPDEEWIGL